MYGFVSHAETQFYEIAAQLIPVLLTVAFLGESRLRIRDRIKSPRIAIALLFISVAALCGGELAALRVLISGEDSETLFGLTLLSIGLGLGFLSQLLAWEGISRWQGPKGEPTRAADWMITTGSLITSLATVLFLAL